jgi:hypothetical protein
LNRPVLKAKPTDKPVIIMGMAKYMTWAKPLDPSSKPPFNIITKAGKASCELLTSNMIRPTRSPAAIADRDDKKEVIPSY